MNRISVGPRKHGHEAQIKNRFENARRAHSEGRLTEAERHCRWVLKQHPEHPDVLHLLALVMKDGGRLNAAVDYLERALKVRPDDPLSLNNLGNVLREQGRVAEAILRYQAALHQDPTYLSAHYNLGVALLAASKPEQALASLQRVVNQSPDDAGAWSQLGAALLDLGRDDEAMTASRRSLELEPLSADGWNGLGLIQADRGEFDEALRCYRRALDIEPGHVKAAINLCKIRRFESVDEPEQILVERALAQTASADDRADLHFALGKINDDCGRYTQAFDHYRQANDRRAATVRYNPRKAEAEVTRLIEIFDQQFFQARNGFGDESELPVFILGMPRSGTTLVEQILAAHPKLHGAGELMELSELAAGLSARIGSGAAYPDCVADMDAAQSRAVAKEYIATLRGRAPEAERVSDKMPGNFRFLGLIALLLPRARIVYCRRHPLDVALSIYFTDFSAGHQYSHTLEHIAAQFRQLLRLMRHWRSAIPSPIHELRYEDMVAEPEAQIRALLEFLGLDWDQRCLDFQNVNRQVHTASAWQVRQPLYVRSVGRWRRYRQQLKPFMHALEPLVNESGYELN